MAKQEGIIKLKGSIGGITFYKSKDGYLARQKGGSTKVRFEKDPSYARTRENASEFGQSGKSAKLFVDAFRPALNKARGARLHGRLVQRMMEVVKSDRVNRRGDRTVQLGDLSLLEGFDFNERACFVGNVVCSVYYAC